MAAVRLCLALAVLAVAHSSITSLKRTVDLTTNLAKTSIRLEVEPSESDTLTFAIPSFNKSSIALVEAFRGTKDPKPLVVTPIPTPKGTPQAHADDQFYTVALPPKKAKSTSFTIKVVETGAIVPFPKQLSSQSAQNLVEYYGSKVWYFPAAVAAQQTLTVEVSMNAKIEQFTSGGKRVENKITYTSDNVAAFSYQSFRIHFSAGVDFVKAESTKRVFQLSHWGMMSCEEEYNLVNTAAEFVGSFSRLDYERSRPATSWETVTAVIPAGAQDHYFRDTIGNISTSRIKHVKVGGQRKQEVELTQRYPLMGGWKAAFYWGFNLDMSKAVEVTDEGVYKVTIQLTQYLKNVASDHLRLEVRLPDGGELVKAEFRDAPLAHTVERLYTTLYVLGRETVVVEREKVVPDLEGSVVVYYTFPAYGKLLHPVFLGSIFAAFFAISLVASRISA